MFLVESLKRLYADGKIGIEKINQLVSKGAINEKEKNYIIRKEDKG